MTYIPTILILTMSYFTFCLIDYIGHKTIKFAKSEHNQPKVEQVFDTIIYLLVSFGWAAVYLFIKHT